MERRVITPKQKQILDYIQGYQEARGYAPTQQEIAGRFGFRSLGTVQNYLVRLQRQGFLRKPWNAKRALEVLGAEPRGLELPLLGRVAAGKPIEAVAGDDTLEVPPFLVKGGENFVLKVVGDSMIEEGILDGDFVVVRRRETAENGQTVVALVDGGATVKRYYRRGGSVALHPANPAMAPIEVGEEQDFHIEGVVVGVIRLL
jgi:repressor LexA